MADTDVENNSHILQDCDEKENLLGGYSSKSHTNVIILLFIIEDSVEDSTGYEDDFFFHGPKINLSLGLRNHIDQVIE